MNAAHELMWTVEQAARFLDLPAEATSRATLAALGRDCTLLARVWNRPTGVAQVTGKPWPTEKTYTRDVIQEVFRRHPATAPHVPQEAQADE